MTTDPTSDKAWYRREVAQRDLTLDETRGALRVAISTLSATVDHDDDKLVGEVLDTLVSLYGVDLSSHNAEITHGYLWGDDTEVIGGDEPRQPYSFFVERIVNAWDDSGDRVDSARRLLEAIGTMIDEWETTS